MTISLDIKGVVIITVLPDQLDVKTGKKLLISRQDNSYSRIKKKNIQITHVLDYINIKQHDIIFLGLLEYFFVLR